MQLKFTVSCAVCTVKTLCRGQWFLVGANHLLKAGQQHTTNNEAAAHPLHGPRTLSKKSEESSTPIVALRSTTFIHNSRLMLKLAVHRFTESFLMICICPKCVQGGFHGSFQTTTKSRELTLLFNFCSFLRMKEMAYSTEL